jgi:hypothetical protein
MRRTLAHIGAAMAGVLVVCAVSAQPALAATPLQSPTQLQAVHVADRSTDLWWTYDLNHREDVVQRRVNNVWQEYARSAGGVFRAVASNGVPCVIEPFQVLVTRVALGKVQYAVHPLIVVAVLL